MIRITGLRKRFAGNTAPALNDLSVEIPTGSFFTLFGPSGCGKSTLLRCIAGLETPDEGEIEINGKVVFSSSRDTFVPPNHRQIGMVFQSYAIWPHMTVLDNVGFPLEARRLLNVKERALAALDLVGLSGFEKRYASRLSGGQQQRVALARAIVGDPALLLLDEPLSNLDTTLRDQMRAELQSLHHRLAITAVYVTHDQTEALSMSDHIAVMNSGNIVELGTPLELYDAPRSVTTARLLGAANIISGVAATEQSGLTKVETACGTFLSADKGNGRVQVYIRPNKIRLLTAAFSDRDGVDVFSYRVRSRRYVGDTTEIDLANADGDSGQVLRCQIPTEHTPVVGDTVRVRIKSMDVRIFGTG